MPRIRSVKPEFFGSEPVGNCSPTSRLLFIALWCMADDDGRCVDNPKIVKAFAFPLDDHITSANVDAMLAELFTARLITRYTVDGRKYLAIRNFREHQHPKKRIASKLPSPEVGEECPTRGELVPHQFPPSSPPVPHQGGSSSPCSGSGSGRVVGEGVTTLPTLFAPADVGGVRKSSGKKAGKSDGPKYPHFPMPLCLEMHALWVSTFGAVEVSAFRKAFGPLFTVTEADRPDEAPRDHELRDALKAYVDLAPRGGGATFATVHRAAAVLALIAGARREHAHDPEQRLEAVMRIIHGNRQQRVAA